MNEPLYNEGDETPPPRSRFRALIAGIFRRDLNGMRRTFRRIDALANTAYARLSVYSLLVLIAIWPTFQDANVLNDFRDAQFLSVYENVAVHTVRDFGQFPFWNPYSCGGMSAFANPQARFTSPTFLFSLIFGARRGEIATVYLMLLLALEGAFQYARTRSRKALGPFLAAPIFGLAGHFAASYYHGWLQFLSYAMVPWLLLGVLHAARGKFGGTVLAAAAAALIVSFGGGYVLAFASVVAGAEVLRTIFEQRNIRVALPTLAMGLPLFLGLSAYRLLPVLETMRTSGRVMAGAPGAAYDRLAEYLASPLAPGGSGLVGGYFFVGVVALSLGALFLTTRRAIVPLIFALLLLWLSSGYSATPSAFAALRSLPVFDTLRYPERFLVFFSLFLAEIVALGVDAWFYRSEHGRPRARAFATILTALLVGALTYSCVDEITQHERVYSSLQRVAMPPWTHDTFHQSRGNRWAASFYPFFERGSIACGEAYPVRTSTELRGDLAEEQYLNDRGAGSVALKKWSPNELRFHVELQRAASLVVNQNWHPGWRANIGRVISDHDLLTVELPAGTHEVTLRFLPRTTIVGLVTTASALLLLLALWRVRTRASQLAVACVPLLVGAVTWLAFAEPPLPHMPYVNQDGSPIFISKIPSDALRVNVQFDVPMTLEAVSFPNGLDDNGVAHMAFYWRVTGDVPHGIGAYVHFEGPSTEHSDREVIGGTYLFHKAPKNVVLRDAVHAALKPGHYHIFMGLWDVASGERLGVVKAPKLAGDRVDLGEFDILLPP